MYWPTCLTYGNWGAPGWSGGQWVSAEDISTWTKAQVYALWLVPAIDDMDECFKRHDWVYQHPEEGVQQWEADLILSEELKGVNPKGGYANAFWWGAIKIFSIKGNIGKKKAQNT